jgi:Rrf2 family iron-sulfur cluster assembly transcriptional regulator
MILTSFPPEPEPPVLSQTSQYALRTVLQLASLPRGDRGSAGDLARTVGIPANYLSKTLHQLARAGVVTGTRGKHGGFVLARPAHRITLAEVVAPFQEVGERTCLLGRPACSDSRPCPAHEQWKAVAERVAGFFSRTTIADLLASENVKKASRRSHGALTAAR